MYKKKKKKRCTFRDQEITRGDNNDRVTNEAHKKHVGITDLKMVTNVENFFIRQHP